MTIKTQVHRWTVCAALPWILVLGLGCPVTGGGGDDGDGDDDGGEGDDGGDGGADEDDADVGSCKSSCDQLKLFDCNDAADQAACYGDCEEASADDIDLFVACVTHDVCDAECIANLRDGFADDGGEEGGEGGGGGGEGEGGGGGPLPVDPIVACEDSCDDLLVFHCIDAGQQSDCRALCNVAPDDPRETFVGCVDAGVAGCAQDCWGVFEDAG